MVGEMKDEEKRKKWAVNPQPQAGALKHTQDQKDVSALHWWTVPPQAFAFLCYSQIRPF